MPNTGFCWCSAFSPTTIALTDALKSSFVHDINSSVEKNIDHAMSMLVAHKKDFKKEELFVMGRYMLHASISVFAAKYINITKLALLNVGNENPFFDGILYEMFFDKEDNCRNKNIEGVWIFDDVAKVCDSPNFASSLTFIQKELEPFKNQVSYVPGNEVHTVRLFLEQSDLWQSSDKKIWIIDDVRFENSSVIDLLDETAYFSISVIAYLDSEEEIQNNVTLDGEFNITLEYDGNGWSVVDYDEMKLEAPYYLYQGGGKLSSKVVSSDAEQGLHLLVVEPADSVTKEPAVGPVEQDIDLLLDNLDSNFGSKISLQRLP